MCNLHSKETEISQKRSKGIKNWNITHSVILGVLWNKTDLILGFSSPLSNNNGSENSRNIQMSEKIEHLRAATVLQKTKTAPKGLNENYLS